MSEEKVNVINVEVRCNECMDHFEAHLPADAIGDNNYPWECPDCGEAECSVLCEA